MHVKNSMHEVGTTQEFGTFKANLKTEVFYLKFIFWTSFDAKLFIKLS